MKKTSLIILFIISVYNFSIAQDCCNYFLKGNEGTKSVLYLYSGKGNKIGQKIIEIKGKNTIEDTTFVKYNHTFTGMGTLPLNFLVKSTENKSYVELKSFLSIENYVNNNIIELSPLWLEYPADMKIGDTLPGYAMSRKYGSYSVDTKLINRKVVSQDTITTPAGNFVCLKITYKLVATAPQGVFSTGYTVWLNKNIGVVKQESTTGSGRLENYLILQSVDTK